MTAEELKEMFGEKYVFQQHLSEQEIMQCLNRKNLREEITAFELAIGVVKIAAVIYPVENVAAIGYDIYVKDAPESEDWICYDNLPNKVNWQSAEMEDAMFSVLDKYVADHQLDYTDCRFEVKEGDTLSLKKV